MQQLMRLDRAPAAGAVVLDVSIGVADDHTPGVDIFTEDFAKTLAPLKAGVQVGYVQQADGSYAAPPEAAVAATQLSAYAADRRFAIETGGILVNGAPIATDRVSQAMIGNAYAYVQASGAASVSYKTSAGFVTLTADQIKAVALAVGAHVQACFKAEDDVDAGINATPATITSFAQVDAAFAGGGSAGITD